ncbi:MAG TPA: phosphoglycerate dehydrogenase, partial [Bdellovibrionota bacterium]|nr:phosphoglycerate dehydrogenase [Bdellovibrionota bacterium]
MIKVEKLAVTSRSFSNHSVLRRELESHFGQVTFNDTGKVLAHDELVPFLRGHSHAIVGLESVGERLLSELPELKVVSKYGVGLDMIDLDALEKRGVLLGWTGGVNRRSVAELALTLALSLVRGIPGSQRNLNGGVWKPAPGRQLTGKTVGILGCGHIGKDLVGLLAPFQCEVLACDLKSYSDFYAEHRVTATSLPELLKRCDLVSIHVPLNDSTRGLLGPRELDLMKPGAFIVNTARGGIVDEGALKQRLQSGHLGGAAFDVFATEPSDDRELLEHPRFLCTPH